MSDRIRIATRKGLFTARRSGGRWKLGEPAFLGDPVSQVLDDPRDGALYAALNLGHFGVKLHRSKDDGATWQELAAPAYPEQPADAPGVPWKMQLLWSLEADRADRPGVLWAGTIPGGLFRSDDHGASWTLLRGLWDRSERQGWFGGGYDAPGIHSIIVDPRLGHRIGAGISCGGMWTSEDGGREWRLTATGMEASFMPPEQRSDPNIQDPHRIVQCRDHPDILWTQHHDGIFRSTDGAASWHRITSAPLSSFGFAVAVHPERGDTAWFVPAVKDERRVPVNARLAVTRTTDGGRTWDVLSRGLPEGPVYDLVYRHGLDVSADGKQLALGSTTGGLWVSGDGGDGWQCLSAHLPPIYSVRFAP